MYVWTRTVVEGEEEEGDEEEEEEEGEEEEETQPPVFASLIIVHAFEEEVLDKINSQRSFFFEKRCVAVMSTTRADNMIMILMISSIQLDTQGHSSH